jgi:hypothetical protein
MPSGLPDIDSLSTFGGALANYNGQAVVNPLTDRDAGAANIAYMDTALMTATAIRCWCRFTCAATTGAMVLVAHNSLWGNGAPVNPVLARTGTGVFTVTFPSSVTDPLTVVHSLNLRAAFAHDLGAPTLYSVRPVVTSSNVITVYTYNSAGSANDLVGIDVNVFGF